MNRSRKKPKKPLVGALFPSIPVLISWQWSLQTEGTTGPKQAKNRGPLGLNQPHTGSNIITYSTITGHIGPLGLIYHTLVAIPLPTVPLQTKQTHQALIIHTLHGSNTITYSTITGHIGPLGLIYHTLVAILIYQYHSTKRLDIYLKLLFIFDLQYIVLDWN